MNNQVDLLQLMDLARATINGAAASDKGGVIAVFAENGVNLPSNITKDELLVAIYKGLQTSPAFKRSFSNYLTGYLVKDTSGLYSSFTADENFMNADDGTDVSSPKKTDASSLLSNDSLKTFLNAGLAFLTSNIANNSNRQGEENAIKYELAQTKKLEAATELAKAQGGNKGGISATYSIGKYVLPVIGVAAILTVGYLVYTKMLKGK